MKNALKFSSLSENDDILRKEIVDTFFKKSVYSASQKKEPKRNNKLALFLLLFLPLTLVLSAFIIILYYKRPPEPATKISPEGFRHSESIIKNGEINRSNVEEAYFDGDAKDESAFLEDSVRLVNFGEYGRAALVVRLKEPADLEGKDILIIARAKHGTKSVNLILKDTQSRFCQFSNISFPASWNIKRLYLEKRNDFDFTGVKQLKLEFGSHTAGNAQASTIYLKEISARGAL